MHLHTYWVWHLVVLCCYGALLVGFGINRGTEADGKHWWPVLFNAYGHSVWSTVADIESMSLLVFIAPIVCGALKCYSYAKAIRKTTADDALITQEYTESYYNIWKYEQFIQGMMISAHTVWLSGANQTLAIFFTCYVVGASLLMIATIRTDLYIPISSDNSSNDLMHMQSANQELKRIRDSRRYPIFIALVMELVSIIVVRVLCIVDTTSIDKHPERSFGHDSLVTYHWMNLLLQLVWHFFYWMTVVNEKGTAMNRLWNGSMTDTITLVQTIFLFISIYQYAVTKGATGIV